MAEEQLEQDQTSEEQEAQNGSDEGGHGALKTAAAASVAAGVSYLFAKKALDSRGQGGSESTGGAGGGDEEADSGGERGSSRKSVPIRAAADVLAWDRAQEMLLPMAEKAAGAAGDFVAREAPEVISERLVPRFIEAFNKARKSGD